MTLKLAPRSDLEALTTRLADVGRVQVPNVLMDPDAEMLATAIRGDVDWGVMLNHASMTYDLQTMQLDALSTRQKVMVAHVIQQGARTGFQFQFDSFRISDVFEAGLAQPAAFSTLYELLNGPEFLAFARALTGDPEITYVDVQATRYRPGHFLTVHNDLAPGQDRRFAFVLNMTRPWRMDWGGLLLFEDDAGDVTSGFTPSFNALNVFKVPQMHAVSMVTPAALGARYSFTGWMHAR